MIYLWHVLALASGLIVIIKGNSIILKRSKLLNTEHNHICKLCLGLAKLPQGRQEYNTVTLTCWEYWILGIRLYSLLNRQKEF